MSKHHKHAILPATHKYRRAALSLNAVQVLAASGLLFSSCVKFEQRHHHRHPCTSVRNILAPLLQVLAKIHDMMLQRKMPPLAEEKDLPPFLLIAATEDQTGYVSSTAHAAKLLDVLMQAPAIHMTFSRSKNLAEEYKLTRVELYELAKLFLEYDEDYDGRLTFGEFKLVGLVYLPFGCSPARPCLSDVTFFDHATCEWVCLSCAGNCARTRWMMQ